MGMFNRNFRFLDDVDVSSETLKMISVVSKGTNAQTLRDVIYKDIPDPENPGKTLKIEIPLSGYKYSWEDGFSIQVEQKNVLDFILYYYACKVIKSTQNAEPNKVSVEAIAHALGKDVGDDIPKSVDYFELSSRNALQLLKESGTRIFIQTAALTVLKGLSSHPAKFSGSWIKVAKTEIKADYQSDIPELRGTINTSLVKDYIPKFHYSGNAAYLAWNTFYNVPIFIPEKNKVYQIIDLLTDRDIIPNILDIFTFSDDNVKEEFLLALESSKENVIPSEVTPGLNNMLLPDGKGGVVAMTPMPRFQVMQSILNRRNEMERDDDFLASLYNKFNATGGYPWFSGFIKLIIDANEQKNGTAYNTGIHYAFDQTPYERKTTKEERRAFAIDRMLKNGNLDLKYILQRPSRDDLETWQAIFSKPNVHTKALESVRNQIAYYVIRSTLKQIKENIPESDEWSNKETSLRNVWKALHSKSSIDHVDVINVSQDIANYFIDCMYHFNKDKVVSDYVRKSVKDAIILGFNKYNEGNVK